MNQEIIDKLVELLYRFSKFLEEHAYIAADNKLNYYYGYIDALNDAQLINLQQYYDGLGCLEISVRHLTKIKTLEKDEIRELVNNALK